MLVWILTISTISTLLTYVFWTNAIWKFTIKFKKIPLKLLQTPWLSDLCKLDASLGGRNLSGWSPPSHWLVSLSVKYFPDCKLLMVGPSHCGRTIPEKVGPNSIGKLAMQASGSKSVCSMPLWPPLLFPSPVPPLGSLNDGL